MLSWLVMRNGNRSLFKLEYVPAELLCVDCETTYVPRGESNACPFCGSMCAVATAGCEVRLVRIEATMAQDVIQVSAEARSGR
jgi:Zn finger protein HypA/HybF involved in hydrogenase expression